MAMTFCSTSNKGLYALCLVIFGGREMPSPMKRRDPTWLLLAMLEQMGCNEVLAMSLVLSIVTARA
jgi:hypothetical protein